MAEDTKRTGPRDGPIEVELTARHAGPGFPRDEIEARIRETVAAGQGSARRAEHDSSVRDWGAARTLLAVAASLLLFVAGAEYGRRTAPPPDVTGGPAEAALGPTMDEAASLPISIQSAGSRYVATLARFTDLTAGLSTEERRIAREVALSILYGAALELLLEAGEDQTLESVAELVATRREALGRGGVEEGR